MSSAVASTPIQLAQDGLIAKAIAVVLWWLGLCWLVPMMTLMMVVGLFVPADRTDWLSRIYCRGQVFWSFNAWKSVVDPAVDPDGVYLFCQNHINLLDHVTMYPATPHFKQGIELASHFKIPVYGWFMKQRGTLAVKKGDRRFFRKLTEGMRAEVEKKHSLLVFPEGTRTTTGRVGEFKIGSFRLAHELGVPIVPVAVTGMYQVLRKGSWLLRPGHQITVHVLAPMPTEGLTRQDLPQLAEACRQQIADIVDAHWDRQGHPS